MTWRRVKVGDLGRVVTGKTPKTAEKDNYGGSIMFVTPSDDMNAKYIYSTGKSITEKGRDSVKGAIIPDGTICVSCIGSDLGKVVITTEECVTNQQINSIIVDTAKYDIDFVYYSMLILGKELNYHSKTSTAVPIVNKSSFSSYEIDCPDIDEQRRIAGILTAIDSKIEENGRINDNLYQQLDIIFHKMIPFQPTDILPEGWQCLSLGSLCDSISIKHSFAKQKLIFLNTGDICDGQFLHDDYSPVVDMPGQAKKSIQKDDILYSEIRPINHHFAYVNFDANDYVVSTKLMVIRANSINSRRLYHYLTSNDVIIELQHEAETRSGTFPQIRFENIQRLPIVIAPREIEDEFSNILSSYYHKIDNNIEENRYLSNLRDTLLPKLMSGELDVSDIEF